jgi:transposase-like protein
MYSIHYIYTVIHIQLLYAHCTSFDKCIIVHYVHYMYTVKLLYRDVKNAQKEQKIKLSCISGLF